MGLHGLLQGHLYLFHFLPGPLQVIQRTNRRCLVQLSEAHATWNAYLQRLWETLLCDTGAGEAEFHDSKLIPSGITLMAEEEARWNRSG
jgi:hypothetical protein